MKQREGDSRLCFKTYSMCDSRDRAGKLLETHVSICGDKKGKTRRERIYSRSAELDDGDCVLRVGCMWLFKDWWILSQRARVFLLSGGMTIL